MVQGGGGVTGGHVTLVYTGMFCGFCVVALGHVTFGHLHVVGGHAVDVIGRGVVITGHVIVGHVVGFGHVLFGHLHGSCIKKTKKTENTYDHYLEFEVFMKCWNICLPDFLTFSLVQVYVVICSIVFLFVLWS